MNNFVKTAFLAACAITLLMSGTSYAGLNGPNPKSARSPGGGSSLGAAQLGGSYNSDGTIIVGIGAAGNATVISTGVYEVKFKRNISACVWTGTIGFGTFSGSTAASSISVTGRVFTNNSLFVQTFNSGGTATNLPFAVHVICG
jgi:hypothetical protein